MRSTQHLRSQYFGSRPSILYARHANALLAFTVIASVALAEYVTAYAAPLFGMIGHAILLALFLSLGTLALDRRYQTFFLTLTLAPLIRIVSLGMPLGHFPQPFWYVLTGIPLFLAAFMIVRTLGLPRRSLGLQLPHGRYLLVDFGVAASGILLGLVEWRILSPPPIVPATSLARILAVAVILLVFTGLLEEVLFRGLLQHVTGTLLGPNAGLVFTAIVFALLHIGWHSLWDLAFVFGVALYFGFTVRYTKSLLGVTLAHGATNTMLFVLLPLALR